MNEPKVRISLHVADEEVESLEVNPLRFIAAHYPLNLQQLATRIEAWQRRAGILRINMFDINAVCTVLQNADRTCRVDYIDHQGRVVALQAQMVEPAGEPPVKEHNLLEHHHYDCTFQKCPHPEECKENGCKYPGRHVADPPPGPRPLLRIRRHDLEPEGMVRVARDLYPTCYWHVECGFPNPNPPMHPIKLSEKHPGYTVVKCTRCGKIAKYPSGEVGIIAGTVVCEEIVSEETPGDRP